MAPLELEGNTLGEKHQNYNKLVKEAITNNNITLNPADDFNTGENDIENLIKIDLASEQRNVDYILKVLKCEDMLYVSRALKKCTWLITDQQYSHIINPEYLKSKVFPEMTSKTIHKLMKEIKLNIKDEKRSEQFFNNERDTKRALKWLPNCSMEFINEQATKHADQLSLKLLKRLCAKSMHVLEVIGRPHENYADKIVLKDRRLTATTFLLRFDTARYLDVVEEQYAFICPDFGKRSSKFLMKTCPERIINNFERYKDHIYLPIFIEYLKKRNIVKDVLFAQANKEQACFLQQYLQRYNVMKCFIDAMPENERTRFVNDIFIKKVYEDNTKIINESDKRAMKNIFRLATSYTSQYRFYDFKTAFAEITKLIRVNSKEQAKRSYLDLLIECADKNTQNIQTVLEYYHEKHYNDSDDLKKEFLSKILAKIHVKNCSHNTWILLDKFFQSLGAYSNSRETSCTTEFIMLYKIMHNEPASEIIENKFRQYMLLKISQKHHFLQYCEKHLDSEGKEQVFKYVLRREMDYINNQKITNEKEFIEAVELLKCILILIKDWNKQLAEYPQVLNKIKEYAELKKNTYNKTDLSAIYTIKKDWKRLMFEDSALLCRSELVYVNMLKHDFQLFTRSKNDVEALCCDKSVSPRLLLNKLRVYWPCSEATSLTNMYFDKINQIELHAAVIFGICSLLPRQQLLHLIQTYAPKDAKVNEVTDVELSLQKELAKRMHIARPPPPPQIVLLFAKGDYLKFILPSLLSVLNNVAAVQVRQDILKLLDAPVSLQKHGIALAQAKLATDEVMEIFSKIWMRTKNFSIRTRIFQSTYEVLRNETDSIKADKTWNLLSTLIDSLTHNEIKAIYELLSKQATMDQLPASIKPQYLMKTHKFLTDLIPVLTDREADRYVYMLKVLTKRIRDFMEVLPSDFVFGILMKYVEETFLVKRIKTDHWGNTESDTIRILSAYVLCVGGDKTREEKYQQFFVPLFQRCLAKKDEPEITKNLEAYLDCLIIDLRDYVFNKKLTFPIDMYDDIKRMLYQFPVSKTYVMITKWNLFVELAKKLNNYRLNSWDEMINKAAPEFGIKCLDLLKADVKSYFPCIYSLFSSALYQIVNTLMTNQKWIVYKYMLMDVEFDPGYLTILSLYPNRGADENDTERQVYKMLNEHPSDEVKMFCKHKFIKEN